MATAATQSTCFWTQEGRPFMHFTYLLKGAEQMIHTGQADLAGGADAADQRDARCGVAIAKRSGGEVVATPYLNIAYKSDWNWQMPPPPPPTRPSAGR